MRLQKNNKYAKKIVNGLGSLIVSIGILTGCNNNNNKDEAVMPTEISIVTETSIVDDDYGIMFNNRRVSKDSVLNEHIIKMLDGRKLWLSLYSKQLFGDYENLEVNQEFGFAGKDDFCFVEDSEIVSYEDMVDEVYLYKWNRKYPSDVKFPKDMLKDFDMDGAADFEGNSHEKITEERYVRKK